MRVTLSLTCVALGVSFSNTPHTGCNDAAPEVVQALTAEAAAEMGYPPDQYKSCADIAAAGGCLLLESTAYSETCCASCASLGGPMKSVYTPHVKGSEWG